MIISSLLVLVMSIEEMHHRGFFGVDLDGGNIDDLLSPATAGCIISVCVISLIASTIGVLGKIQPKLRLRFLKNPKIEVLASLVLFFLWLAAVIVIQNSENSIAMVENCNRIEILNSNLFFASWVALSLNIYNLLQILEEHQVTNVQSMIDIMPQEMFSWQLQFFLGIGLLVFSVCDKDVNCNKDCASGCGDANRSRYIDKDMIGVKYDCYSSYICFLGTFTTVLAGSSIFISMIAISSAHRGIVAPKIDIILGSLSMLAHFAGVFILTSITGPNSKQGNVYFILWMTLLNAVRILSAATYTFVDMKHNERIINSSEDPDVHSVVGAPPIFASRRDEPELPPDKSFFALSNNSYHTI